MPYPKDTIFALSTAPGKAGIAVIRITGTRSFSVAEEMITGKLPPLREAGLRRIIDPHTGELLDQGLLLCFKAPHSFTGLDLVEFHIHGGPAIVGKFMRILSSLNIFPAGPGDFTRLAFEHGKLDLTEAEALADLIDAETEGQRKQALRQMEGGLRSFYEKWRNGLLQSLALVEAEIDFVDEEDVPDSLLSSVLPTLSEISQDIDQHLRDGHRGERLRQGVRVALIGPPNAGKSSLLNALAKRDVAIVSEQSGTTRDIIEVHLDLGGVPVTFGDTAGLRVSDDEIESEGIRRAKALSEEADLRLFVIDGSKETSVEDIQEIERGLLKEGDFILLNKEDLVSKGDGDQAQKIQFQGNIFSISAKTGSGLERLTSSLAKTVQDRFGLLEVPSLTRARHRLELETCQNALGRCLENPMGDISLFAEDLRHACHALGRLTGRVDVEDILDRIFSDFCIGK